MKIDSRFVVLTFAATAIAVTAAAQAPLGEGEEIAWVHVPYEVGACDMCHETDNLDDPGQITAPINELCLECHEFIAEAVESWDSVHEVVTDDCTYCHNPHNAGYRMLLHDEVPTLCLDCHDDIGDGVAVTHGALESERSCLSCHDPHASQVGRLLLERPYDLCVDCHGVDGVEDQDGKALTNIAALIEANPVLHGPVEEKDCSICHLPHGGENFRMLIDPYPAAFYAPFELSTYGLCFNCHDEALVTEERTSTLTGFRDGDRNLHFLHVNREKRGRTCRACHEVHAAKQEHIIRDGVPYGSSGWMLPVAFMPAENGGTCSKTCHPARTYDRLAVAAAE